MATKKAKPKFKVGDAVTLEWGFRRVPAVILEDRGQLGVGGRRIYRIEMPVDSSDPVQFEIPEVDLAPAEAETELQPA
jgi:hypothetical protein